MYINIFIICVTEFVYLYYVNIYVCVFVYSLIVANAFWVLFDPKDRNKQTKYDTKVKFQINHMYMCSSCSCCQNTLIHDTYTYIYAYKRL